MICSNNDLCVYFFALIGLISAIQFENGEVIKAILETHPLPNNAIFKIPHKMPCDTPIIIKWHFDTVSTKTFTPTSPSLNGIAINYNLTLLFVKSHTCVM